MKPRLTKTPSIAIARARLTTPAWSVATGAAAAEEELPGDPLEAVIEAARQLADRAADVLEQADALGADRRPDLGRLGDPLDQLLGLLAGQQPLPDLVDQFAVHRLDQSTLDGVALEGSLDRVFDDRPVEDAGHRPLDRFAFDRGDDRLLGGDLDRAVDTGRLGDRARPSDADAEQARRERQVTVLTYLVRCHRPRSRAVFHPAASIRPAGGISDRDDRAGDR